MHFVQFCYDMRYDTVTYRRGTVLADEPWRPIVTDFSLTAEAFRGIPPDSVGRLMLQARRHTFRPGSQLMRQGDVGESMYVIVRGCVRVERVHSSLTLPLVLADLGAGEVVGEMGVLDASQRVATVTAIEQTEALEVTADALRQVLDEYPSASRTDELARNSQEAGA